MHKRFDEKVGYCTKFQCIETGDILDFIESEIQLALAEREQEIIWMIEDLRGFPACVLSEEQAKEIIDLITREE